MPKFYNVWVKTVTLFTVEADDEYDARERGYDAAVYDDNPVQIQHEVLDAKEVI